MWNPRIWPLLLLLHGAAFAQPAGNTPRFSVRHFGTAEGLPDRQVTSLEQDAQGFIWLGSPAGLLRFDGYVFTAYTRANGLTTDAVERIQFDANGLLWVQHPGGSIDVFDPRTAQARSVGVHFGDQLPMPFHGEMQGAAWTADGTVVLAHGDEIMLYRSARTGFTIIQTHCGGSLRPIRYDPPDHVWCLRVPLTEGQGEHVDLLRVAVAGAYTGRYELMARGVELVSMGRDRAKDQGPTDRSLFYAGLSQRTTAQGTEYVAPIIAHRWHPDGHSSSYPDRPLIDGTGALIGTLFRQHLGNDLWMVDATLRRASAHEDPVTAPVIFDLASAFPHLRFGPKEVLRDHAGHLWMATDFGLFKIELREDLFQRWLHDPQARYGIGKRVRGMAWAADRLHVNTELEGYWQVSSAGEPDHSAAAHIFRFGLCADGAGGIWRSERNSVVHSAADGTVLRHLQSDRPGNELWCMLPLDDGSLLVGSSHGLLRSRPDNALTSVAQPTHNVLERSTVNHLARDREGTIWACTNSGLYQLDPTGRATARWWPDAPGGINDPHHLPAGDIRHFFEDSTGIRWLATATNGLVRWDVAAGTCTTLDRNTGLPGNSVYAAYADHAGYLWLPTDNGLVRYAPTTGEVTTYTTEEGIAHDEFNRAAHARAIDGRLFFGGLNGITVVDPQRIDHPTTSDTIPFVLTRLQRHTKNGIMEDMITGTANPYVRMQADDRFLSLDFALLSYDDPKSIHYAWRVDGIDTDWNLQQEPHLRFTALPYGRHLVRIKARGRDGRWNPLELRIPVHMVRPIHLRWWFIAAVIVCVALCGYLLFRYRMSQLRRVIDMRDRIALDLHDEVGSTLSSVALFSTVVNQRSQDRPLEEIAMLRRIAQNSAQAMESMNDVVWSVNSRYDKLQDVFDRMRAFAGPIAEANQWDLELDLDPSLNDQKLSMSQRKDLYLIFKEAVNNAVKHAQCTRLIIRVQRTGHTIRMIISDNGVGIHTDATGMLRLAGQGLHSMQHRAEALGGDIERISPATGGTTIILQFQPNGR